MSILAKVPGENGLIIGGYYLRPDGSVCLAHGVYNGTVHWCTDRPSVWGSSDCTEASTWTWLPDLRDFLDAEDPRLPYEFDLNHDVHTLGQLISEYDGLENCLADPDLMSLCKNYEIDLRDPQTIRDYNTRCAAEKATQDTKEAAE